MQEHLEQCWEHLLLIKPLLTSRGCTAVAVRTELGHRYLRKMEQENPETEFTSLLAIKKCIHLTNTFLYDDCNL